MDANNYFGPGLFRRRVDDPAAPSASTNAGRPAPETPSASNPTAEGSSQNERPPQPPRRPKRRRYKPRTCRICLENVQPTTELDESMLPSFLSAAPRVRYVSEDPSLGRLISPCRCQGTQKYVHAGCLRAWRSARFSDRNLWTCPTCLYEYKFERLRWGRLLANPSLRVGLTVSILLVAIFLLGFIADPIINLYVDPYGSIFNPILDYFGAGISDEEAAIRREFELRFPTAPDNIDPDEPATWSFHFLKGFFSFGLLGFIKSFLTLTPFQWFYFRPALNGRRAGGGRERLESVNLALVIIGVFTFLAGAWKVVNLLTGRLLETASDRIIEVGTDEDDEVDGDSGSENE